MRLWCEDFDLQALINNWNIWIILFAPIIGAFFYEEESIEINIKYILIFM